MCASEYRDEMRCFKPVDLLPYLSSGQGLYMMEGRDDHPGVALPLLLRD